ncbi:MAG: hypothetical protein R6X19_08550 [Kiritimatiellia bacterium]
MTPLELMIKIEADLAELKKLNVALGDNAKALGTVEAAAKVAGETTADTTADTQKLGEAAKASGDATQDKTEKEKDSTESMKHLQGVGQQLSSALNGNISAMTRSIAVTPEFARQLQAAFSVLGALTFGYGVGSGIYTSLVDPLISAQFALKGVATEAEQASLAISKSLSDEHVTRMNDLAAASERLSKSFADKREALEEEISFTNDLFEARAALEEQKIMSMPAGAERDRALADFRSRSSLGQIENSEAAASGRREIAKEKSDNAGGLYRAALEELKRFSGDSLEKLPGLRKQFDDLMSKSKENEGLWNATKTLVGRGPQSVDGSVNAVQEELSQTMKGLTGYKETLQKVEDLAKKYKEAREAHRVAIREDQQLGIILEPRREAVARKRQNEIGNIDNQESERIAKNSRDAEKAALQAERQRIDDERKRVEDSIRQAKDRSLPEQLAAQREKGEAQTARDLMSADPKNPEKQRNYERQLAEAREAVALADQNVAQLGNALAKIIAGQKKLEAIVRNLPIQ